MADTADSAPGATPESAEPTAPTGPTAPGEAGAGEGRRAPDRSSAHEDVTAPAGGPIADRTANPLDGIDIGVEHPVFLSYAHAVAGARPELVVHVGRAPAEAGAPPLRLSLEFSIECDGVVLAVPAPLVDVEADDGPVSLSTPIALERTELLGMAEQRPTLLVVTMRAGDWCREERMSGPEVLAARQWIVGQDQAWAAMTLSTFVQPQHPRLSDLEREAATLLDQWTGSASLDGYQGGPERVDAAVDALCHAFAARSIAYAPPQGSWSERGHRLRDAEDVLQGRLASRLDAALVLASALEHLRVEPLVVVCGATAVLGYWKSERHSAENVAMPGWQLVNQIDRGLIGLVDTGSLVESPPPPLREVAARARRILRADGSGARFVVSVRQARLEGARPQPVRSVGQDGAVVEIAAPVVERSNTITLENLPEQGGPRPSLPAAPPRVEGWKAALLDLSARNRLIHCPDSAVASHRLVELAVPEAVMGAVEDLIASGSAITLEGAGERAAACRRTGRAFHEELDPPLLAPGIADHRRVQVDVSNDAYFSALRALRSQARTLVQETGTNNLYLALGSLVWTTRGTTVRSPLVFVPVELSTRSARSPYTLRIDPAGAPTPNYSLVERLRLDLGLVVPGLREPAADEAGIDVPALFDAVRAALAEAGLPFHVEATTYLGIFNFGNFRLWKDLEESWELLARNPLVHHLIHSPDAAFADPRADAAPPPAEEVLPTLPIPADASQVGVVARALAGHTLVVEGPPGTGKSQTIANLVMRLLAEGRKVMFVAEKQAALDVVYRRIAAQGFGPLVLNLHDRKQKPALVRRRILDASELEPHPNSVRIESVRHRVEAGREALDAYARALHSTTASGMSAYEARASLVAYGDARPALAITGPQLAALDGAGAAELRDEAVPRLRDCLLGLDGDRGRASAFLGAPVDDADIDAVADAIGELHEVARADDDGLLVALAALDEAEAEVVASVLGATAYPLPALSRLADPAWRAAARSLRDRLAAPPDAPALDYFQPDALEADLAPVRDAVSDATHALFRRRTKTGRAFGPLAQYRITSTPLPRSPRAALDLIDDLVACAAQDRELRELWRRVLPEAAGLHVGTWSAARGEDRSAALREVEFLIGLEGAFDGPPGTALSRACGIALAAAGGGAGERERVRQRVARARDCLGRIAAQPVLRPLPIDRLVALSGALAGMGRADRCADLRAHSALERALEPLARLGLVDAAAQVRERQIGPFELATALEVGLARATIDQRLRHGPLRAFTRAVHEHSADAYADDLASLRALLPQGLIARALASHRERLEGQGTRLDDLKRELARRVRARGIRDLVGEYGDLITDITPCVLVSPDSVARFFPAERQDFDVVVFDEASQITVASAVGAMGRGRSAIVCGDSNQMPPTSFAKLSREAEDADGFPDEESILTECVSAHVPRAWLSWHYRSQDEALIAFSNRQYYGGRLSSFPSPQAPASAPGRGHGVSMRLVEGRFIRSVPRGGERRTLRTNPEEAAAIVDEVRARFAAEASPSIGVVTFNLPQRDLVETSLRDLDDPRITSSLDADDGLFVKNLENVQGDERDTVLFSVAFAHDESGRVPLNFGPLNLPGGERRLNVAVTRARREVVVFASFEPDELEAERSQSRGLRDLKEYLRLARLGPDEYARHSPRLPEPDDHREQIAARLREAGAVVSTDVGLSDFRIDLVLAPRHDPGAPSLAVLLDGKGWAARGTVYDRDVLPRSVLSGLMGWPGVERVWLPDWVADPQGVVDRLMGRLEEASAGAAAGGGRRCCARPTAREAPGGQAG